MSPHHCLGAGALHWLPGETCYSFTARYHVVAANRLARNSSLELFGHPTAGTRHDFSGQLSELSRRTGGALGDGPSIAFERTLLRYYLPFQSHEFAAAAIETLQGPDLSKLKSQLGLLSSRFRAHHPLKACLACMDHDKRRHSVAYWHLNHQCPGVWWCDRHDEPLVQFSLKANNVQRFLLHLPRRRDLNHWTSQSRAATRGAASSLSRIAGGLLSEPLGCHFSRERLADVYATQIEIRYGIDRVHAPASHSVASEFFGVISQLFALPEFDLAPSSVAAATTALRRLLKPRSNSHPIWHLVMAQWLFGDWSAFRGAFDSTSTPAQHVAECGTPRSAESPGPVQALALHRAGKTTTAIARQLDVDPSTAAAWLAKSGIGTPRRAKVLKADKRQRAIDALRTGADKHRVATDAEVSVGSITRLLRTEPGLQARWHQKRRDDRQNEARCSWERALAAAGAAGINAARSLAAADYAWLYRNDRQWLADHGAASPSVPRGRYAAQWSHRDQEVCFEVLASIMKLPANLPHRARAMALIQMTPRLERYKGSLDKMPLTRDIVASFTGKKTASS